MSYKAANIIIIDLCYNNNNNNNYYTTTTIFACGVDKHRYRLNRSIYVHPAFKQIIPESAKTSVIAKMAHLKWEPGGARYIRGRRWEGARARLRHWPVDVIGPMILFWCTLFAEWWMAFRARVDVVIDCLKTRCTAAAADVRLNYDVDLLYTVSQKKGPTLKRYSSKLYGSILMIFGGNIQKSLE